MAEECILEVIGAVKQSLARSNDTCDETGDESSGTIQGSGEESVRIIVVDPYGRQELL